MAKKEKQAITDELQVLTYLSSKNGQWTNGDLIEKELLGTIHYSIVRTVLETLLSLNYIEFERALFNYKITIQGAQFLKESNI